MPLNIECEIAALERLAVRQLQAKFAELFGEPTRVTSKAWLVKRLAWRLQALAEGDLSERARRRAAELANDADLRWLPPRSPRSRSATDDVAPAPNASTAADDRECADQPSAHTEQLGGSSDQRLPPPGAILTRVYLGQTHAVEVLPGGFAYRGRFFRSLSALAKAITGSHCNGYFFFRQALTAAKQGGTP
jgi:DUF2924 family protein